jgi:tRNA(Ile)-lysidine synthase
MHPLAVRALRTIRRHDLFPRGARVAAAVSGGSDSVALLLILRELEAAGELVCAGIAHLNHGLRLEGAPRDQAFCLDLGARLGLPVEIGSADVAALARQRHTSKEDAARVARYQFLSEAAVKLGASSVAVGHTRDDQAETFLMHVIRGAGSRGQRGIHPRRGLIVRPLLQIRREELRAYLRDRHVPFCHDETNDDVAMVRNRVRRELIPLLEQRFNPSIVDVLARNAEIAAADEAYFAEAARELYERAVKVGNGHVLIECQALAGAPAALAWRVALDAMRTYAGERGLEHALTVVELARGGPARADLPGVRAERIGGRLVLQKRAERRSQPAGNSFSYLLSIPGEVQLREAGCVISARTASADQARLLLRRAPAGAGRRVAVVSAAALGASLTVRNRRPGDAFRPFGLRGRKKLQDFFVDRKVDRSGRDRVPLVVDDRDRIVWVAGHEIAEEFRVADKAQAVVILRLKTFSKAAGTGAAAVG